MHREIDEKTARQVLRILTRKCGYLLLDQRDADAFVMAITTTGKNRPCMEYRFMGALGFGGKFRNNGNHENTPHVDCYREHETPARLAMIEAANAELAALFAASPPTSM